MYKVFSNNKAVSFCEQHKLFTIPDNCLITDFVSEELMIAQHREFLSSPEMKEMFINCGKHVNKIFRLFTSHFLLLKAAGGVVENPEGDVLFIYRCGRWDLPKGKVEKKEKTKNTAIREVEEETGIKMLTITGQLSPIYHTYYQDEKEILKKTYWYKMMTTDRSQPIPQTNENISLVRWFKPTELGEVLNNTYDSLKIMIEDLKKK